VTLSPRHQHHLRTDDVGTTGTDRLERQYAPDVETIPEEGQREEEQTQPIRALPSVIQQKLRHARPQVQRGADIAEDLAGDVEVQRFC